MWKSSSILLYIVLTTVGTYSQGNNWQYIEFAKTNYAVSEILKSGHDVWAVSAAEGASTWNDESRSWRECARFTYANYVRAYCAGDNGSIYVLLNKAEAVVRIDNVGTQIIRELSTRRLYQTMLYLNIGKVIEVGARYDGKAVNGSVFDSNSEQQLATLPFTNVESVALTNPSSCSGPVLTVIDRTSANKTVVRSFVMNVTDYSWKEMTNALDAVSAVEMNGSLLSLRYADTTSVMRSSCESSDVAYRQPRAMNRLLGRANGQLVGWVSSGTDTGTPMFWISNDGGVTFAPFDEARMISGYVTGMAEIGDSALIFAVDGNVYRYGTMLERVDHPRGPFTQVRTEITSITPTRIVVGRDYGAMKDNVYDLSTGLWSSLVDRTGKDLQSGMFTLLDNCIIFSDREGCYRMDLDSSIIRAIQYESGAPTGGILVAAYQDSDGRICMFLNDKWYRTDQTQNSATLLLETNWPKNVANNALTPHMVVKIRHGGRETLVAGTKSVWTQVTDDTLVIFYPLYGVLTSTDDGATWEMSNNGLGSDLYCWDMVVHDSLVYAVMSYATGLNQTRGRLYRSTDQGKTWASGAVLPAEFGNPIEISVDRNGTLYCAGGGLVMSRDMGDTWQSINGPPDVSPFIPYDCQATDYGLYVLTEIGLYKTDIVSSVNEPSAISEEPPYWSGDAIRFSSTVDIDSAEIGLYDVYGRTLEITRTGQQIAPLNRPSAGLYLLTINGKTHKLTYR